MTIGIDEIKRRLNPAQSRMDVDRIVVTPLLIPEDQFGTVEIDLRLGRQFLLFREHLQSKLSLWNFRENEEHLSKYQEEIVIPFNDGIVLHPGSFLIGSTLEYVALPCDLEAQVEGRSSWARLGLIIATATTIHPLYKGVITLELSNNGTIPIELQPGMKISQIIFHKVSPPVSIEKASRYSGQIGPGFSRIYKDAILKMF